ncbi:MAG: alkaline phosphatase family protein [Polyangiaceae bacterium]|nr:alkaline phosphatase family protein [Polyangiaceae bacterium]
MKAGILGLLTVSFSVACTRWIGSWDVVPPDPVAATPPILTLAPTSTTAPREPPQTRSVVLVVLDGVRWQEIFLGTDRAQLRKIGASSTDALSAEQLLPNLYRLISRGFALGAPGHGAPISASGPYFISMPGYREIFSGEPDSTCTSNTCPRIDRLTIVDRIRAASGRDEDAAVIASWDVLDRTAVFNPDSVVISTGQTLGANQHRIAAASPRCAELLREGRRAGAWPGHGGYRPDRITAPLALAYLEAVRPRFLFVGLGDTDEFAHASDYRGYLDALRAADRFLGDLSATLERLDLLETTSILVTTDHGRAWNFHSHGRSEPESGRVFLIGAGGAIPTVGYAEARSGVTLSAVAPTILGLLGVGSAPGAVEEPWMAAGRLEAHCLLFPSPSSGR